MKNVIKMGMVLVVLAAVVMIYHQQELKENAPLAEASSFSVKQSFSSADQSQPSEMKKEIEGDRPSSSPGVLGGQVDRQQRQYNAEYMKAFLKERREMERLEMVSIGRNEHHISKSYKAVLLSEGEGEGYYKVGSWSVVPLDYNDEEGRPVLYNKNNRMVGILTGLVSVKLKEGISLERGVEFIARESGLEVDGVTRHLKIIHSKFSPITGGALKDYRKKLEDTGLFSWVEIEIAGDGSDLN